MTTQNTLTADLPTHPFTGLDIDQVQDLSEQDSVLIIDDDADSVTMLKVILQAAGFNVLGALDGPEGLKKFSETNPDIILLDMWMPDMDGLQVIQHLRNLSEVPVLVVSAVAQEDSVVNAFNTGADDYIRKPFSAREIVARVKAALRRAGCVEPVNVRVFPSKQLTINLETRQISLRGEEIKLSPNEFSVLKILANHAPKPAQYSTITEALWEEDSPNTRNRLKWVIHTLRRKMETTPSKPELIINHTNFGYQFNT